MRLSGSKLPRASRQRETHNVPRSGPVFRREGEYWTIIYEGTVFRLRDAKGLYCVAYLLRHPDEAVAAVDLLMVTDRSAARILAPSVPRSLPVDLEHARTTVTKRIRGTVAKIGTQHPSLGHHLSTCIKTGSWCAYTPGPRHCQPWRL